MKAMERLISHQKKRVYMAELIVHCTNLVFGNVSEPALMT